MPEDKTAFRLRFRTEQIHDRLRDRAKAEHKSMNDLANDAIEALLDGKASRPVATIDKTTLRRLMVEIALEDRDIFDALKKA